MWAAAWEQLPSGSAKTDGASARVSRSSCQPRLRLTPPPSRPARVGLRLSALGLGPGRTTMASSEEDGASNGSMEEKNSKKAPRRHRAVTTAWLIFYNITMTAGWLVLAIAMARFYMDKGTHKGLYKSIQKTLKFFQTFALLEIVHCAVGVVHTSVLVTGVQVSSRIFMVWFITHSIKQAASAHLHQVPEAPSRNSQRTEDVCNSAQLCKQNLIGFSFASALHMGDKDLKAIGDGYLS
ncbi:very-long-chain (3R)-3-hydroxyacyl-CoA dehydratase 1 isoform X7 [Hemicordylus capensis]|uniref:very-long-chain (3R)-3-hydroxyacyl-CoA dehydratase 1 isoform X7 n=1 Tax=Hemicordylus capensis TaxID=884348 RepID=UPI00230412FB|nr:very-long-chain (3R)-3-hydroxyacyl-CoA dehydratase 1 isoform X7 [Hemicordylus capensis]